MNNDQCRNAVLSYGPPLRAALKPPVGPRCCRCSPKALVELEWTAAPVARPFDSHLPTARMPSAPWSGHGCVPLPKG